ncbi:LysR substrate-binding domain-containing protein [Phytohabitans flavus]|uniref:LysR family transcriptional regulator n=1 Tax=Phytohabitans flavus TaxID=1076124 RepID=A0A6F8XN60_9ACTN|nr:LysR family transcriptional regulator [Phytohabitans flavus]BCB75272.1 LysR family transcriptional regulator [Phytohabitans flavus]
MEIRHLRYFLAVADELHFGRAAERLRMTQPPLSRRIADLEQELGLKLFERGSRGVTLTEHGRRLQQPARRAVAAFDAAAAAMSRPSRAAAHELRIAFPADTSAAVLTAVAGGLRRTGLEVELVEATTAEQVQLLREGAIDLGVLRHPFPPQGLCPSRQLRQPLGVIMPADHPLAARSRLRLPDLRGQTLVMFHRAMAPGLYDQTLTICRRHGYRPQRIHHASRIVDGLLVVDAAVSFNVEASALRWPGVVWRPLAQEDLEWRTSVVRRRGEVHDSLRGATRLMLNALRAHDGWQPDAAP